MKPRLLPGLLFGATVLAGGAAQAAPFIAAFEAHDDMHAGALWRNDRPNNNNQRGAGCEHQSLALTGDRVVVLATCSYTDVVPLIAGYGYSSAQANVLPPSDGDPGVQARGTRVQAMCTSYKVDPMVGLVKSNMAYITKNNSPDWQNGHKTRAQVIDGGKAILALYGYDPNGVNTSTYGTVIGPDCQILSAQTRLISANNDDVGGVGLGDGTDLSQLYFDQGGKSRICGTSIGNGNGQDDHRAWCVTSQATGQTGANSYTLATNFNISIEPNEERGRSAIVKTTIPDRMFACWAAGNTQPPNRGVRCGLINTAEGVADGQRLVWRQYVQQRAGNLMYTTPSLAPVLDANGAATNKVIMTYVEVDTSNRQGRSKGRSKILTVPLEVSATGLTMTDTAKAGLFGIADGAHPGMCSGFYGADKRPVGFMFAGSITDGGTANVKIVGMDSAGKLEPLRAINWASASSGGYTSLWYGHNPNTPQGRTYPPPCRAMANPGYGVAGGYQPTVSQFLVVPNVYHKDHSGNCTPDPNKGTNNGTCGGKNALGIVLIPTAADPEQEQGDPTDPNNPFPTDPTDETPGDGGDGPDDGGNNGGGSTTLGGCSTTGGTEGVATMLLLGLGLVAARRRRAR